MRTAIIGCGAAGTARAAVAGELFGAENLVCIDQNPARAEAAAKTLGCEPGTDWTGTIAREDIDAVVISTATRDHATIAIEAMNAGKHVFCEAPIARTPAEAQQMIYTLETKSRVFSVAATHRYTPTAREAKRLYVSGEIGKLLFIRGWAGQSSWSGTETWYADQELSGGGTLMSNGIALLDLVRWFAGDFEEAVGYKDTALWPIEPVEDNAFGLFRTIDEGRVATIHSSWTSWKDRLQLEICGSKGYMNVDITESIIKINKQNEAFPMMEERVIDLLVEPDLSIRLELQDFYSAITEGRESGSGGYDGLRAVQMAYAIYRSSEKHCTVDMRES